jgi:hypothetical protein
MTDDLQAQIKALYDQIQNPLPLPSIAALCPITKFTAELRERVSAAIRANATSLRLSGNSVVEVIHKRHEEIVRELLEHHQQCQLALFLDTNGTDAGLRRMSAGSINAPNIETGSASIEGENGTLVGPVSTLAEFGREFVVDRGYEAPAFEPTSLRTLGDLEPAVCPEPEATAIEGNRRAATIATTEPQQSVTSPAPDSGSEPIRHRDRKKAETAKRNQEILKEAAQHGLANKTAAAQKIARSRRMKAPTVYRIITSEARKNNGRNS